MTTTGRKRIGVVGVFHETNSFSARDTAIEGFQQRWYEGEQFFGAFTGSRTVGGGFLDGNEAAGLLSVPLFATYATPSGPISAAAFAEIMTSVESALDGTSDLDGVLLELHGDMHVRGVLDPEEVIVAAVRRAVGDVPIVAVLDFHANMGVSRLSEVDVVVGYRENPHVDTYDRGRDATRLLERLVGGEPSPRRSHRGLPIVVPPVGQRTDAAPYEELATRARRLAEHPSIWAVNVHGGYAYLDAAYTGLGFTAYADSDCAAAAEAAVDELDAVARALFSVSPIAYRDAEQAITAAVATTGAVAVADTGDNINGGSPGDTTWLAHAAAQHPAELFLTTLCDAGALELLRNVPVGGSAEVVLGGWSGESAGPPLCGRVTMLGRSDGTFVNTGPMATGMTVDMGAACWVRFGNVDLVIQQLATQPNDPELFRHLGIDLRRYGVFLLKGAAAVRAGWAPVVDSFIDAGTRGETDSVLSRLPYAEFRGSTRV